MEDYGFGDYVFAGMCYLVVAYFLWGCWICIYY